MLSLTNQALEKFDNQHDLERMCADILNALGNQDVTPIAPRGGGDGGRDITFKISNAEKGLACATLRKDSDKKFKEDFHQRNKGDYQVYILFTTQYLSAAQKLAYEKYCVNDLEARLIIYDLEGLRSLLDTALKPIRKRYLNIDDDDSAKIKSTVKKILKYPDTLVQNNYQDRAGYAEWKLTNPATRELFYSLIDVNDDDLNQVPDIGPALLRYRELYYSMRQSTDELGKLCKKQISERPLTEYQIIHGWKIYFNYFLARSFGNTKEQAQKMAATNYDITLDDCERAFGSMSMDVDVSSTIQKINTTSGQLGTIGDELMLALGLK